MRVVVFGRLECVCAGEGEGLLTVWELPHLVSARVNANADRNREAEGNERSLSAIGQELFRDSDSMWPGICGAEGQIPDWRSKEQGTIILVDRKHPCSSVPMIT